MAVLQAILESNELRGSKSPGTPSRGDPCRGVAAAEAGPQPADLVARIDQSIDRAAEA
jgi:hypothetical protein